MFLLDIYILKLYICFFPFLVSFYVALHSCFLFYLPNFFFFSFAAFFASSSLLHFLARIMSALLKIFEGPFVRYYCLLILFSVYFTLFFIFSFLYSCSFYSLSYSFPSFIIGISSFFLFFLPILFIFSVFALHL